MMQFLQHVRSSLAAVEKASAERRKLPPKPSQNWRKDPQAVAGRRVDVSRARTEKMRSGFKKTIGRPMGTRGY